MAKLCTIRAVSCTCRFAPLCPGFGGRGRAFSSSEKKPPAGLKEGSWKKSNRARALSMSHSRCAVSVAKRGVPAAGRSLVVVSAIMRPVVMNEDGVYRRGAGLTRRVRRLTWSGPFGFPWRARRSATKTPAFEGWKSLDFLGFSVRIETFQWVTWDFRWRKILVACLPTAAVKREIPRPRSCGGAELFTTEV